MKRLIIQLTIFSKELDDLLNQKKLMIDDFELFEKRLVENPEIGTLIPGTGGIRKIRLKSSSKGKRGGFRICYFDDSLCERLFLMIIYSKNEQEDLSSEEKNILKYLITVIKTKRK